MDFPKSVPSAGLVDGKFIDEDPLAGTPGSLIPSAWGNAITLEVLNVILASGLTPDEGDNTQLLAAIRVLSKQPNLLIDTGAANSYAAVNVPALAALPTTGYLQKVKIANANTGAATYVPDGLVAKPIYGLGLQPLQGGELLPGVAVLMYLVQASVNGGSGAWILIESLGGAEQVTPGSKSQHAVNVGQIQSQGLTAFTAGGTAAALTLTPSPAITAYAPDQRWRVKFGANSVGGSTLNVSGVGPKSLKQYDSAGNKVAAVFAVGQLSDVEYDGTDMVLLDQLPVASVGFSQCQLKFVSATAINLAPFNGNNLVINGASRPIPAAGVTLSNSGLTASTLYYIYAFWTGSAIALEASTTGHSQDAATGIEIKTGDATRALVGMVYTSASSQFADSAANRLVASWFNRRAVGAGVITSTTFSYATLAPSEVSTALRVQFLNWANEAVDARATGQYTASVGVSVSAQLYIDGSPYGNRSATYIAVDNAGYTYATTSNLTPAGAYLAEGRHLSTIFGGLSSGAGGITETAHTLTTRI